LRIARAGLLVQGAQRGGDYQPFTLSRLGVPTLSNVASDGPYSDFKSVMSRRETDYSAAARQGRATTRMV